MKKVVAGLPQLARRLYERHAKHAMMLQGVFEHPAKTQLENIERKQGVGKKQRAGQRHDRDFPGQLNCVLHRSFVRFAHGNEYTRGLCSEMTPTIEANDFASEPDNFRSTFGATANPVVPLFASCRGARS